MALLGNIIEGVFDAVADRMEGITPDIKKDRRFRRQTERQRMSKPIIESPERERFFEFGRNQMVVQSVMSGAGYERYEVRFPVEIMYPSSTIWHSAFYHDANSVYSVLTGNPISVPGCQLCVVDQSTEKDIEPVPDENWFVGRFIIFALVEAEY